VRKNKSIVVINKDLLGVFTVRGISFKVKNQERMVLLGANSSGASSLIQSVLSVNMILDGEVVINGDVKISKHYNECNRLHGIVGYQPQRNSIDDDLTVLQHLTLFSRLAGISNRDRDQEVDDIIAACSLVDLKAKKA